MKLQEMIGLAVFDVESGKEVGRIHDFILDGKWLITGLELEGKALFSSYVKFIAWEDITAYGEDAVMIRSREAVQKLGTGHIPYTYHVGKRRLKEMQVLTEDGVLLGRICDVYFEQEKGNTILGLEISDGFVSDLIEGRKWLPCTMDMVIGEHAVMVPPMSEQRLEKAINFVNG
ncbi:MULTISPECIES: PRC-barrel domain-containing protein [Paenibacillus]|uniref:Photosystem reaction center subunit H n=1 Tax=Paenibacillus campinasensis TaxID=66347 RepID=A0A268F5C4_9BACL|nr:MULTISPECIES: PRC-barrel domain-containing protein [Paenibacillus]MUG64430.1 photosystem reaction center subunit H [Paenibacillus campinasensis]PAD80554.1 photosystem reaction center subunit H [Paenibacillus campinasensis]PAK55152.1 photosystem reaction center subunit H [Paenibacillus sp. 7541]